MTIRRARDLRIAAIIHVATLKNSIGSRNMLMGIWSGVIKS